MRLSVHFPSGEDSVLKCYKFKRNGGNEISMDLILALALSPYFVHRKVYIGA